MSDIIRRRLTATAAVALALSGDPVTVLANRTAGIADAARDGELVAEDFIEYGDRSKTFR